MVVCCGCWVYSNKNGVIWKVLSRSKSELKLMNAVFVPASVEVCSVLAGEKRHLWEGRSVGEQHQRVRTLHHSQPHPQGTRCTAGNMFSSELRIRTNTSCLFSCMQCGNQTRSVQHYWYTSWPDHKTPDSALPLLQLMADVETDRRAATTVGPVIVHCRYW